MSGYDTYWEAVAFLRHWRSPFSASIDAARAQVTEAEGLAAKAGELPAVEADAGDDAEAALVALREAVAALQRFDEAIAQRERVVGWMERATPEGPLAAWREDARARLVGVDDALAEGRTADAQAEMAALLAGVDAAQTALSDEIAKNRAAAQEAVGAFEEVCRIVRQDVRLMDAKLAALEENRENDRRLATWTLAFCVFVGTTVGSSAGWALDGGDEGAIRWAGLGLAIGLGLGLGAWLFRERASEGRVAEHLAHARQLESEAVQARVEVLGELEALERQALRLADAGRELKMMGSSPGHRALVERVGSPDATHELAGFLAQAPRRWKPDPWLRTASIVSAVGVSVGAILVIVVSLMPARQVIVEATENIPASPPLEPLPTIPTPVSPASAKRTAEARRADPPPAFTSGTWKGTLGPSTVVADLKGEGHAVSGTFRVEGPDGTQTCGARGRLQGARVWLTVDGCASRITLEGQLSPEGKLVKGTAKSTIDFQGKEVVAMDTWEMAAGGP
ncbi:MAG: hypothetical protein ACOZNI_18530 [Myxococcota bacterium]